MGHAARTRAAAAEQMLPHEHVPIVAGLSLAEAVLNNVQGLSLTPYQQQQCDGIMRYLVRLHDSFPGKVEDSLITKCDRYLCKAQDAMDTFFDELTPEDLAEMARVKGNWPQHTGDGPTPAVKEMKYWNCGLPEGDGHFHVTHKGAVDCMARQKRRIAKEGK
jgi:hypothetical protein